MSLLGILSRRIRRTPYWGWRGGTGLSTPSSSSRAMVKSSICRRSRVWYLLHKPNCRRSKNGIPNSDTDIWYNWYSGLIRIWCRNATPVAYSRPFSRCTATHQKLRDYVEAPKLPVELFNHHFGLPSSLLRPRALQTWTRIRSRKPSSSRSSLSRTRPMRDSSWRFECPHVPFVFCKRQS